MTTTDETPRVSGDDGGTGHLEELRRDPIGLMTRVREECGDVGLFRLAQNEVVLLTGAEANEVFFRASDAELDQAEAYPFMTPVFGEGVVFDASPERRREMLHNQSLRDKYMRGHAATITSEIDRMLATWDDSGSIDLLDWSAELFIYTSSACLIGQRFREELDRRFADLFHELERGTDAVAFVDPYADIDSFRRRDAARAELVELIDAIMSRRQDDLDRGRQVPADERDLVDVLMSITDDEGRWRFSADQVTGMFISMMFAGHHTTSTTASWTIIELLRHPEVMARVVAEMDDLAERSGGTISYQDLREVPWLEASIKETLRLHPPLILLLRKAMVPVDVGGYRIMPGQLVGASPAISNRLPDAFADADTFDPSRYITPRDDERDNPWNWIPFGAGRHRCVGAAFAMMQLKTIFCVLLREYSFELAQPPETYRNDHSKMVVQLARPCDVRYRRRTADHVPSTSGGVVADTVPGVGAFSIEVDRDLCQSHGVCVGEAPALFDLPRHETVRVARSVLEEHERAAAEAAVRYCPTHALRIVDIDQRHDADLQHDAGAALSPGVVETSTPVREAIERRAGGAEDGL